VSFTLQQPRLYRRSTCPRSLPITRSSYSRRCANCFTPSSCRFLRVSTSGAVDPVHLQIGCLFLTCPPWYVPKRSGRTNLLFKLFSPFHLICFFDEFYRPFLIPALALLTSSYPLVHFSLLCYYSRIFNPSVLPSLFPPQPCTHSRIDRLFLKPHERSVPSGSISIAIARFSFSIGDLCIFFFSPIIRLAVVYPDKSLHPPPYDP